MPSSTSSGPDASGVTSPRISPPRAPSGNTSTSGDTTAPSRRSTTCSAARSARRRSPTRPGPRRASTASRSTPPPGGEQRGRDNAKNVDGRKRHIVVDSMGLLMAVLVTAADLDDAKAAAELFARLDGQPMGNVVRMYADSKYHNFELYEWVETNVDWDLTSCNARRMRGLGDVADPVDGGADVRMAGEMSAAEQGPGEERRVFGGVHQIGHDPDDAQPARAQRNRCRVQLSDGCINPLMGQTLSENEISGITWPLRWWISASADSAFGSTSKWIAWTIWSSIPRSDRMPRSR